MASLVFTSTSGSASFSALPAGAQHSVGQYWLRAPYRGPQHRIEKQKAPGQSGSIIKRHGFAKRTGHCQVVYIGASADACRTARANDEANIFNIKCSVAIPDGPTFSECEIMDSETLLGPRLTESGNYQLQVRYNWEEVRE